LPIRYFDDIGHGMLAIKQALRDREGERLGFTCG
jgi:hypothetical protein